MTEAGINTFSALWLTIVLPVVRLTTQTPIVAASLPENLTMLCAPANDMQNKAQSDRINFFMLQNYNLPIYFIHFNMIYCSYMKENA